MERKRPLCLEKHSVLINLSLMSTATPAGGLLNKSSSGLIMYYNGHLMYNLVQLTARYAGSQFLDNSLYVNDNTDVHAVVVDAEQESMACGPCRAN